MSSETYAQWAFQGADHPLALVKKPLPDVGDNKVLVLNKGIGINPVDWKLIRDNPLGWQTGHVPGVDGVGIIARVGTQVDESLVGQSVAYHAALKKDGSFSAFTILHKGRFMQLPQGMSFELAAALPCPLLTAWQAFQKIPVRKNKSVLVAGLGAVNKLLVQLLSKAGFHVDVLSKSISDEQAKALGISNVFRTQEVIDRQYFAIFDAVGKSSAESKVPLLKANGHIICILDRIPEPIDPPFTRAISYHEIALGALHDFGNSSDWQELMNDGAQLLDQIHRGEIIVEKPECFGFRDFSRALKHSEQSKQKTVVIVAP